MSGRDLDQRLWRVRRRHDSIEAHLRPVPSGWSLQFSRNGRMIFAQTWPTRDEAASAANVRLQELLRVGWNEHW